MTHLMQNIVEEMDTLPKYFQERAARRMAVALHEIIVEMLLWDYEAKRRYAERLTEVSD